MDSVASEHMAQVLKVYEDLICDSSLLAQGPALLENALNSIPNFADISLKVFVSSARENPQRCIYIGALFKSILVDHWQTNPSLISQKKEIRETLLHGIIMNVGDLKMIEQIALMITIVISYDGVDLWANSLKEIIQWMPSDDHAIINTGLELFCTIFAKAAEKCRTDKILPETFSLAPIIPSLMLSLYNIFAKTDNLAEKQREKVLVLLYLTISSFAYADGTDNKLVAACLDETFKTWMGLFISALSTNPKTHIAMKRYIIKILIVLFRDFTYYTRDTLAARVQPIWKFLNAILPLYVWTTVYGIPVAQLDQNLQPTSDPLAIIAQQATQAASGQSQYTENLDDRFLEDDEEFNGEVEGLAINTIELVSTIVTNDSLHMLIKQAVYPLVNALAHFILLTREQELLWVNEPNQFVSDDDDESNMKTQRSLVHNLLFQLIERFGDQTTQALMVIAEKFMMNYDEAHTTQVIQSFYDKLSTNDFKAFGSSDFTKDKLMDFVRSSSFDCSLPAHAWKKREVGLLLLGSFSDDVIDFQYKHTSSFDITSLISNLIADIQSPSAIPILVAKSLWCVSRFSEIIGAKATQLFLPLFQVTATCLSKHYEFPVRLTATKAIGIFAHKINHYKEQLPDRSEWIKFAVEDTSILNEIFDVLNHVTIDTVHIILDTLVYLNKLSSVYVPVTATLGARPILQIFTLQHSDSLVSKIIIELITQIAENPVAFDILFSSAFSTFIIDSFLLIKHHTQENPSLAQIKPQDISLMATIFDVTSIFVKNCQPNRVNESLIHLLPPLLNLMALNEENSLQQHASICLNNFLKVSSPFIIQQNLVKDVLQVIMKLLQVPANSQLESSSTYSGNLCMIAFNNLLGGSADPEILKQVVYKVFRSKLATTVQGLILVWARMIISNAAESVNFLCSFSVENRQALKILIDKWLLQQPVFRGTHTKHATFLALTKLFLLKDKRIENLIAIAYNPSHSNIGNDVSAPFKIFSTLIRGLDNEMIQMQRHKESANGFLSGSGDDEDNDERIDAEDDFDDNGSGKGDQFKDDADDRIEVDLNVIQDEDDGDIQRRFAVGETKAGGLGEFETGSTNYMTEGFAFGYDDGDECDETTEEDLVYLKESYLETSTVDMLKEFFNDLAKNDPKYFAECLRHLLKEDVELLGKYVSLKNVEALELAAAQH